MKIAYTEKNFAPKTLMVIEKANEIIEEYQADGMDLTLRQLYYQFVSRDLIENKQSEYNRLGSIINDARLAGYIDWNAIEDRTRNIKGNTHWTDPGQIVRAAAYSFQLDHWRNQDYHVEVWIEKEALIGVIASICNVLDVSFFACKGYVSQSEMWQASQRMIEHAKTGGQPIIIHLGDHDPSGIDMTRDIIDRQRMFFAQDVLIAPEIHRIALNMDQVEEHNPPPNPAKLTDSRCKGYIKNYGNKSWELDALEPRTLKSLIERKVLQYRDESLYQKTIEKEQEYIDILKNIEEKWKSL